MRRASEPDPAAWDLTAEAPAKLNLALEIVRRRPDGYHDLRTVFQAVDLADTLLVRERTGPGIALSVEGLPGIPAGPGNLVVRAGEALRARHGRDRGAEIRLVKRIPAGAGLGGGSSDAAAALLALEDLWGLPPDPAERFRLAAELGSDVPFFLLGGTALGEGRGEILTRLPAPPACGWVVVIPDFGVSTTAAYTQVSETLTETDRHLKVLLSALERGDLRLLASRISNDLEAGVLRIEPRLARIRSELERLPVLAVGLTGSGAALFALTESQGTARDLADHAPPPGGCRLICVEPVGYGARVVSR